MTDESPASREQRGVEARDRVPLSTHAALSTVDRVNPVHVLRGQIPSRVAELVPLRHERMGASPFAFFRGAAAIMAADLAATPRSGFEVQLCGDAHLSNFGLFASPERTLVFDINDFDETFAGPWEWDLKRLVASLVVAGRANGFAPEKNRKAVVAAVRRYQSAMSSFAAMTNLDLWYSRLEKDRVEHILGSTLDKSLRARIDKAEAKARTRDHLRALDRLTEMVDGERRIIADPPIVVPVSDLASDVSRDDIRSTVSDILAGYAATLAPGMHLLLDSYSFVDLARKVVGVGSVGTRCWLVLMQGRDDHDPLFLQVKEAQASVLQAHLGETPYASEGQRVVSGQRLMQAASDAFLGWHSVAGLDGVTRDFYVRQLHDWKGSADVETLSTKGLRLYGELCSWTLARAHARTGDRIAIAAYVGDDDVLPEALADFAEAYADVNEADFAAFTAAVASGELAAPAR